MGFQLWGIPNQENRCTQTRIRLDSSSIKTSAGSGTCGPLPTEVHVATSWQLSCHHPRWGHQRKSLSPGQCQRTFLRAYSTHSCRMGDKHERRAAGITWFRKKGRAGHLPHHTVCMVLLAQPSRKMACQRSLRTKQTFLIFLHKCHHGWLARDYPHWAKLRRRVVSYCICTA